MIDAATKQATHKTQTPPPTLEDILSPAHLEVLSHNAAQVYRTIFMTMTFKNQTVIVVDNSEVSRRSRVLLQNIEAAQRELAQAGLLMIDPGTNSSRYEFVEDTEVAE